MTISTFNFLRSLIGCAKFEMSQDGHHVTFESRKLNNTERMYMVQEKEMTTVVYCLRTCRHHLLESQFVAMTDNVVTSYFHIQKKLSLKQVRWQDFFAEFDYVLGEQAWEGELQGRCIKLEDGASVHQSSREPHDPTAKSTH